MIIACRIDRGCAVGGDLARMDTNSHGWPVGEFVGCDKRQRRHTMSEIRCACALLVTPYKVPIINNWPAVPEVPEFGFRLNCDRPWSNMSFPPCLQLRGSCLPDFFFGSNRHVAIPSATDVGSRSARDRMAKILVVSLSDSVLRSVSDFCCGGMLPGGGGSVAGPATGRTL